MDHRVNRDGNCSCGVQLVLQGSYGAEKEFAQHIQHMAFPEAECLPTFRRGETNLQGRMTTVSDQELIRRMRKTAVRDA